MPRPDTVDMQIRELRRSGHFPSLVAALMHFDVSFMVWVLLGALGTYVAKDLGLSSAQKGLMVAVPPLGGAVFRIVLGSLADRVGIKGLGLITMGLTTIPLLWGALGGGSYAQVIGIGLLLGVAGASFAVALPLTSRWYPPEMQGLALGIAGAGNSGTVVAALVAPRLAEHVGWHGTFALALIPVCLAWVAFAILAKEPPSSGGKSVFPLRLLGESDARWLCGFYSVTFGVFVGLAGYLSIFFVDNFGLSKVQAGTCAAICTVAGSLLRPVGGSLADRLGATRVLSAVLTIAGALALAMSTLPILWASVVVLFVMLGALGMGNGAVFQAVGVRMPARVGAMTGLVGAAGGLGGFALPFAFGSLRSTTGGFGTGFALLSVTFGATAVAAWSRTHRWVSVPTMVRA
jgi:NNP family nitrate/nitrite transporter-like MFS transporter